MAKSHKHYTRSKEVAFHIGAHKTASTHLQKSLEMNKEEMTKLGVSYLDTTKYRRELSPLERAVSRGEDISEVKPKYKYVLDNHAPDAKRLILSDENILVLKNPIWKNGLYPQAEDRLRRTRDLINQQKVEFFLSIRNPSTFLPSLYIEYIRHFTFVPPEAFTRGVLLRRISWYELIKRLLNASHPDDVFSIWRYEDYSIDPTAAISRIIKFADPGKIQALKDRIRVTPPSEVVLETIKKCTDHPGENAKNLLGSFGRAQLSTMDKFQLHSPETAQRLNDIYEEDVAKIRSLDRVALIP